MIRNYNLSNTSEHNKVFKEPCFDVNNCYAKEITVCYYKYSNNCPGVCKLCNEGFGEALGLDKIINDMKNENGKKNE